MAYQLVTQPTEEPISLAEARLHLRIDDDLTADDTLISALIVAARQFAENETRRALVTQTWRLVLDCFPGQASYTVPLRPFGLPPNAILLERCPVKSVQSIRYLDMGGIWQTMSPADYTVDLTSEPARITPCFGKIWQPTLPQIGAVEVVFVTGYGTAAEVPAALKSWMKLRIGSLYEHRGEAEIVSRGKLEPMPFVDGLLDPYRMIL
ncbi:head-tail connector protein [Chitinimonas sp.]|uniref:head-tail connector protein n=1 Tax=Chitinimonas sp. TaxID=1934313 RepID=UPI0035B3739E